MAVDNMEVMHPAASPPIAVSRTPSAPRSRTGASLAAEPLPFPTRERSLGEIVAPVAAPVVLVVLGLIGLLAVDLPLSAAMRDKSVIPGAFRRLLDDVETFGAPWGQILIAWAIALLAPGCRRRLVRLAACAAGAGLAADAIKLFVIRTRPKYFDFDAASGLGFGAGLEFDLRTSSLQGFPSAHTPPAVGFAIALGWMFPRGRLLFCTLAVLVGLQRISSLSHFASDVCAGAIVGWGVAQLLQPGSRWTSGLNRWEGQG